MSYKKLNHKHMRAANILQPNIAIYKQHPAIMG